MNTTKYALMAVIFFVFTAMFGQDGALDMTFNGTGILFPTHNDLESEHLFLKVQPDGKIITAETVDDHGSNSQFYISRYDPNGVLDPSFGGGTVISNFAGLTARINGVELNSEGKIIVGGILGGVPFIARYNSNGVIDSSFGNGGVRIIGGEFFQTFAVQSDGKILLAYGIGGVRKLLRFDSNGTLDAGFGSGGEINLIGAPAAAINVQSEGKILVASGNGDFVFTRYLNNGSIDAAFGTGGTVTINVEDYDFLNSVKIQSDNKVVFIGRSQNSSTFADSYRLIRLMPDGGVDNDFGAAGMVLLTQNGSNLEIQNDGKIVVAGSYPIIDAPNEFALSRFLDNGDSDLTFGSNGIVTTALGGGPKRIEPFSLEKTADGKILAGGVFCLGVLNCERHSFVARYNINQLSLPKFDSKNSFTVFPNPVSQSVTVDLNLTQSETLSMDLFDIRGKKISNLLDNGNFLSGFNSLKINLPEKLSNGIYFLNITNGKNYATVKLVK